MKQQILALSLAGIVLALASCSDDESTVAPPTPNPSTDRYVNQTTGDDANSGSSGLPWATITHAVATADSEITIHVASGTYDAAGGETFPITLKNGQTLLGNVANKGAGLSPTLVRGEGPYTASALVPGATIVGAQDARVAGFSIRTETSPFTYTGIAVDGVDMEIDNNTFLFESYSGVTSGNGANVDIHDNRILTESYGLYLDGSRIVIVFNNNIEAGSFGMRCYGIDSLHVANNVIGTTNVGVQWGSGTAGVIQANVFNGSGFSNGAILNHGDNLVVRGNWFNAGPGVQVAPGSGVPDVGAVASPGQNNFAGIVGVGLEHNGSGTVMAIGNVWVNTPPQVGVDIVITGGGSVVTE